MHYEERVCFAVTLPPPTRLSAIGYDQVRLVSIREHQASGVTGAYSGLRVENFVCSFAPSASKTKNLLVMRSLFVTGSLCPS